MKRLLSIKEQLPCLGKDIDGFVEFDKSLPDQKMVRPDYQALKDNPVNNEVAFIMCLIGLATMNPLHKVDGFKGNFNIFEIREGIESHFGLKAGLEFAEIMVDMKQKIEIGVATNKIKRGEAGYCAPPAPIHGPFHVDFYYDTLPFLNWMKQFFPIPKELIPLGKKSKQAHAVIDVKPGTTWDQIKFRIVNDERIEISVHNKMEPYSRVALGFAKKRDVWLLMENFAANKGDLFFQDYKPVKANVSSLRKHLKNIFPGIDGSPIKNYDSTHGYVCNFRIMDSSTR